MAFAIVGSGTYAGGSWATSVAPAKPEGVAANDILFALLTRDGNIGDVTAPEGWTAIGDYTKGTADRWWLYYKVAGGSEGTTYTWQWANPQKSMGLVVAYRDAFSTADPIDAVGNGEYVTSDTTLRATTVTVSAADSPLVMVGAAFYATAPVTFTTPASPGTWTEDYDTGNATPDWWGCFHHTVIGAGATGSVDATMDSSQTTKHAFLVALNPPSGATTTPLHLLRTKFIPAQIGGRNG